MTRRLSPLLLVAVVTAACAGGAPVLEYGVPAPDEVRYSYADTSRVGVSVMGQDMELAQRAVAEYAVTFSPAPSGVNVTMALTELTGTLTQPMGGPVRLDRDDVEGALVFSLDRRGNAVIAERPTVSLNASQVVSGLALAHGFFPGLPGQSVSAGDTWVDTVSYEGPDGVGNRSERAVLQYTVVGDTVVDGRTLLRIDLGGSSVSTAEVSVAGMNVSQRSELETEGYVLWDAAAGLLVERHSTATGRGTAAVPIAPNPIPIRIRTRQHIQLQGR